MEDFGYRVFTASKITQSLSGNNTSETLVRFYTKFEMFKWQITNN